ncbi:hypothetical protein L7F22_023204 [Adiantum nelumboides]|nr:hypothetical protein [Adiantum nelumboides]
MPSEWLLDTGATHHMTPHRSWLHGYQPLTRHVPVYLRDNHSLSAVGHGHLHVTLPSRTSVIIHNIYHNPGLNRNILSVTEATSTGSFIEFFHDSCVIHFKLPDGQFEILRLPQRERLYPIPITLARGNGALVNSTSKISAHFTRTSTTLLWHYWLGHIKGPILQRMPRNHLSLGLPHNMSPIDLCEGCLMGKASHKTFPISESRTSQVNQLVHSDLCGPMESTSLTGSVYFQTFIDDFSRYTTIYFLKQKSQSLSCFQEYCNMVVRQHDLPLQILRSDNGGEYISHSFQLFCKNEGIKQQFTVPYTPQQNGVFERKNRTLVDAARAMLLTASPLMSCWEEAVSKACYLQNRTPHARDPQSTPYFHWFGKVPQLQHLLIFGCNAYPVKALPLRHKLDPTSTRTVYVGYGDRFGVKAYRFYDPQLKKFQFFHSVYFDEASLITPQQGDLTPSQSVHNPQPNLKPSPPQIEWEEADVWTPQAIPFSSPPSPIHQVPPSPTPIHTPLPLATTPWSLGHQTKTHLFPPLLPLEPTSKPSGPVSATRASHPPTRPYVPVKPIHQPSLLDPSSAPQPQPSKASKVRSLKEIYEETSHTIHLDPAPLLMSTAETTSDYMLTAEALYH